MIPYGHQTISEEDIEAVVEVLRSDWLTQGPTLERFEQTVAAYCDAAAGVAVSHGTAALHLACRALKLGPGDRVWTSPNTFVASANAALYCGCEVDFVDIDPRTYNLSIEALETKLQQAETQGRLPTALIAVHFAGQSCDMAEIWRLSRQYGFHVIEDACHAIGGRYLGELIGCCRYSDMTVFSFHPVKLITTGEGGMVLTNDAALYKRLQLLRNHGISREEPELSVRDEGGWYYEQIELGYNYRLTDMQAALGLAQLQRLDSFVDRRRELVQRYDAALARLPLVLPWQSPDTASAWHLYVVQADVEASGRTRRELYDYLHEAGIGAGVHYIPVHTQPYYQRMGFCEGDFPEAEKYYRRAITLPLFPVLTEEQQDQVVRCLQSFFNIAASGPRGT